MTVNNIGQIIAIIVLVLCVVLAAVGQLAIPIAALIGALAIARLV